MDRIEHLKKLRKAVNRLMLLRRRWETLRDHPAMRRSVKRCRLEMDAQAETVRKMAEDV